MERVIEKYLSENGYNLNEVLTKRDRLVQYTFVNPSGTTCVAKFQSHDYGSEIAKWVTIEFGVGVLFNDLANSILRSVSDYISDCNYPFRCIIAPRNDVFSLLVIQFRCEVCAIQETYIAELLDAGQRLAEYVRNEFGIEIICQQLAS